MKIVRRTGIIILTLLLLVFIVINFSLLNRAKKETVMNPENIMVVSAPDQTEPMENPEFEVKEFVPVLPEGANVALEGKAEVSSFADVYTGIKTIDGKAGGNSYWEAKADSYPNILTIDLKSSYDISAVRVCLNPENVWGARTQTFSVLTSMDGITYTELIPSASYDFMPVTGNEAVLKFDTINCQYIQLQFTGNTGSKGAQVAELEIYSIQKGK